MRENLGETHATFARHKNETNSFYGQENPRNPCYTTDPQTYVNSCTFSVYLLSCWASDTSWGPTGPEKPCEGGTVDQWNTRRQEQQEQQQQQQKMNHSSFLKNFTVHMLSEQPAFCLIRKLDALSSAAAFKNFRREEKIFVQKKLTKNIQHRLPKL